MLPLTETLFPPIAPLADGVVLPAFWEGLWQGVFELIALGLVAFWANVIYRRHKAKADARQELVDEIDEFTKSLYKPRKIYQSVLEGKLATLEAEGDEAVRTGRRLEILHRSFEEFVEAVGRFRAFQVKLVPLYGYNRELFGYYLAIWRYLRVLRKRMEASETLYFHHEKPESRDAFYRLIDAFRYRVAIEPFADRPPGLVQPPREMLERTKARGDEIYAAHFDVDPDAAAEGADSAGTVV